MREIVHLQIGQCGNQIGAKYWELIAEDHGVRPNGSLEAIDAQLDGIGACFSQEGNGKYIPRAVLVDTEPAGGPAIEHVRSSAYGALFREENFILGGAGAGNNWAKGHYTEGAKMAGRVLEALRREAEQCGNLRGFQLTHSLGGGTGSGLGALLLDKMREEFPGRIMSTFTVLPSPKVSDTVVEPYNAVLSLPHLADAADETVCIDNTVLYDVCARTLERTTVTYADLNSPAAAAVAGVSAAWRFPLNADVIGALIHKKRPRLHFFTPSFVPLGAKDGAPPLTVAELTQQVFDARNALVPCDPRKGRCLAAAAIFRGCSMTANEVDHAMETVRNNSDTNWLPQNVQTVVCDVPARGQPTSATVIAHSTAIRHSFKRISDQFAALFRRKGFLHWYTNEGMDEAEFADAAVKVDNLIAEYQEATTEDNAEFKGEAVKTE